MCPSSPQNIQVALADDLTGGLGGLLGGKFTAAGGAASLAGTWDEAFEGHWPI